MQGNVGNISCWHALSLTVWFSQGNILQRIWLKATDSAMHNQKGY